MSIATIAGVPVELDAVVRDAIHCGRLYMGIPKTRNRVPVHLVHVDKKYVRSFHYFSPVNVISLSAKRWPISTIPAVL